MKKTLILLALALFAPVIGGLASQATDRFTGAWLKGLNAQSRLISSGGPQAGAYTVGVEVQLAAKTVTYWRSPGEAGVPPTFDFAASKNVAKAQVLYPAPSRILEAGGIVAFGYQNDVIFPIHVTPLNLAKAVELALKLNYAACEKICVPIRADLILELAPVAVSSPNAELIAAALLAVPQPANASLVKIKRIAGAVKPSWNVSVKPVLAGAQDLFLEVPDGYYADAKLAGDDFLVTLSEYPEQADLRAVKVHFTATSPTGAVEWDGSLDAAPTKP